MVECEGEYGCGDCDVREGEAHIYGCCQETCKDCGGQYFYCACVRPDLGTIIPYISFPQRCFKCGVLRPNFFMAKNWEKVVPNKVQKEILCLKCYRLISKMVREVNKIGEDDDEIKMVDFGIEGEDDEAT